MINENINLISYQDKKDKENKDDKERNEVKI
jgi:hypothetical protein